MATQKTLFLSHSHLDNDIAKQIAHELELKGCRCWFDEAEIRPGESIIAKVEAAIDEMDYVGIVLTPNSVCSTWVLAELRMALSDELLGKKIRVIGLVVRECVLPGFLRDKLYIDFRMSFQEGVKRLWTVLTSGEVHVELPQQGKLSRFIERTSDEVWKAIGIRGTQRQTAGDVIRMMTESELSLAIALAESWKGDKVWNDQLERLASGVSRADSSETKRLVRQLVAHGILEAADDLDYPSGGLWAYFPTDLMWTLRNSAREARSAGAF